MAFSSLSAVVVDVPSTAAPPCVFFKVPTDTGFIHLNPFSPTYFYDTRSLICLLAIGFIEINILTADDRHDVRAYQRRHGYNMAATHVLDTPFNPTKAEQAWWLGKYNAHRERQNRIIVNRFFLEEVFAIECIVINRLSAEKEKRAERAKLAKKLERAVISVKRPLPLDDDSDEAERSAKRQRLNNGVSSAEQPPLDPRQLNKCRLDIVDDEVQLCDCKPSCRHMKRSYYYNIALEKVPIVYPVITAQPTKAQSKSVAVTVLMEGTTDDTVDGVAEVNAKNSPIVDEPMPESDGPSFTKVYMKRKAAAFTRKDARKRMEWRTQGWKSTERKRKGSALKCELKLMPSKLNSEDTIIVDRTEAGRGKQGGATVHALVKLNAAASSTKYKILALTRDASSEKAAALASLPGVSLLQGNLAKPETLFNAPIHGVFLYGPSPEGNLILDEETEARVLVDLEVKRGIQHVVYTSADYSGTEENALPNYESKRAIERYLQSHESLPAYTIIRPTGFMENFYWPAYLQSISSKLNPNLKYKLIAVNDIGYAVASAFDDPATFTGKAIDLAGDALTPGQIVAAFRDVVGMDLDAKTPQEFPPFFKKAFDFWNQHEFVADPAACRELLPNLIDLRKWLESSTFKK